jgi:hypothetical protein
MIELEGTTYIHENTRYNMADAKRLGLDKKFEAQGKGATAEKPAPKKREPAKNKARTPEETK